MSAGALDTARAYHAAALLPDGRVVITGGSDGDRLGSSEITSGATQFVSAPNLLRARSAHAMVVHSAGVILIGGAGDDDEGSVTSLADVELIDVDTNGRVALPALDRPRSNTTAVALRDGRVLACGGNDGSTMLSTCVVLSADLSGWSAPIEMGAPHVTPFSVLLDDDRVLIAGGTATSAGGASDRAHVFDAGAIVDMPNMSRPRDGAAVTRLTDGRVLVAGGSSSVEDTFTTAELFDPITNAWTLVASLPEGRANAVAVTLLAGDGRAALFGGIGDDFERAPLLYDPTTNRWITGASLAFQRYAHTATALLDGSVLVVGGVDAAFSHIGTAERWTP